MVSATGAAAQSVGIAVSRTDGTTVVGDVVRAAEGTLALSVAGQPVNIALTHVLALHAGVPRSGPAVSARLVGGDEICGELRGGDASGETLMVESRSLGSVSIPVDRLQALVVHRVAGDSDVGAIAVPSDADHDEALFLPAKRGFDMVGGAIHRFTSDGVLFAPATGGEARTYPLDKIAAVALRGGKDPARKSGALLVTRSGDIVSVDLVRADATTVELADDRRRAFSLPWAEVATLLFLGDDRLFLSELQPAAVAEGSALAGDEPLYSWRRDRNVRGGFLVVGGRTYPRGLGVHSKCELTFRVPDGFESFCVAVGIDDEVLALPARGDVDVAVLVDGKMVAERTHVTVGAPPVAFAILPVRGGSSLTLRVDFGAGLDLGDRADWLHAVLLRKRPPRSGP